MFLQGFKIVWLKKRLETGCTVPCEKPNTLKSIKKIQFKKILHDHIFAAEK